VSGVSFAVGTLEDPTDGRWRCPAGRQVHITLATCVALGAAQSVCCQVVRNG